MTLQNHRKAIRYVNDQTKACSHFEQMKGCNKTQFILKMGITLIHITLHKPQLTVIYYNYM